MDFYKTGYTETGLMLDDDVDIGDLFGQYTLTIPYRFANPFIDWAAVKREVLTNFIKIDCPYEFDMVYLYGDNIEGLTIRPVDIGKVIEQIFLGENIQFVVVIRRLSYFWFQVEVYEDRLNSIVNEIESFMASNSNNDGSLKYYDLYAVLNNKCPIKVWKFMKYK